MVSVSRGWITKFSTHPLIGSYLKPDFWLTSHWETRDHRPVTSRASQLGRTIPSAFGQAKYSLLRQACQHQTNLFSSLFFLDLPHLPWLALGKYTLHKCLRSSLDMTQVFTWNHSGAHWESLLVLRAVSLLGRPVDFALMKVISYCRPFQSTVKNTSISTWLWRHCFAENKIYDLFT